MKVAGLSGLVIDRRVEEFSPCRELSTIRLSQDSPPHASVDIVVRDPDGRFPLGKRLDVSLEDAA